MLLTITNTKSPATDLGYLLHKNPNRLQSSELSFGKAQVFYPEASPNRCTAALLLYVDPVGLCVLVVGRVASAGCSITTSMTGPYVASSCMSVAATARSRSVSSEGTRVADLDDLSFRALGE